MCSNHRWKSTPIAASFTTQGFITSFSKIITVFFAKLTLHPQIVPFHAILWPSISTHTHIYIYYLTFNFEDSNSHNQIKLEQQALKSSKTWLPQHWVLFCIPGNWWWYVSWGCYPTPKSQTVCIKYSNCSITKSSKDQQPITWIYCTWNRGRKRVSWIPLQKL